MAQEEMLDRFRKSEVSMVQANIAQSTFQDSRPRGRGFGGAEVEEEEVLKGAKILRITLIGHNVNHVENLAIYIVWQCFHYFDQSFQNPTKPIGNNTPYAQPTPPPPTFHNPKAFLATPAIVTNPSW